MPVLSKAAEKLSIEPLSLIITCGSGTIRLYETDILYIEALRHHITIYTNKGECKLKENISAFSDKLAVQRQYWKIMADGVHTTARTAHSPLNF